MNRNLTEINWPNGQSSLSKIGEDWLKEAFKVGIEIPTGCLNGSCGACEIEVNGKTVRACISSIPNSTSHKLKVEFSYDPYW